MHVHAVRGAHPHSAPLPSPLAPSSPRSAEAYRKKEPPLGTLQCDGASAFLKEVKGKDEIHRFTLSTSERQLKLRCDKTEFARWASALRPMIGEVERINGRDDDDDD